MARALHFRDGMEKPGLSEMSNWKCTICGFVDGSDVAPAHCPECGARDAMFVRTNEAPHGIPHNPIQPHDERDQNGLIMGPGECVGED
jgi:hypothetical protein